MRPNPSTSADDPARLRSALVDGRRIEFAWTMAGGRRLLRIGHRLHRIDDIRVSEGDVRFMLDGTWIETSVRDERDLLLERFGFNRTGASADGHVKAPMPGRIHQLLVSEGAQVEMDQPVAILEAMKMENELKSPVSGIIVRLHVSTGSSVEKNQLILEIDPIG
jgi:pyruvate carboxylase subunit B